MLLSEKRESIEEQTDIQPHIQSSPHLIHNREVKGRERARKLEN